MFSQTRSTTLSESWRKRADFKGYDRSKGSQYNSWRSIVYTQKGKAIGFPQTWKDFAAFVNDVGGEWRRGMIVRRVDTNLPHSKANSLWAEKGEENLGRLTTLTVGGVTKSLVEWCDIHSLNYQGVRQRFFKGKNLSPEEILFGRYKVVRGDREVSEAKRTNGLLGAYRLRDKKRGFSTNVTLEFLREEIKKGCFYCGATDKVGLDRIDNRHGHTVDNVVPCCSVCNTARMDNFSFSEMVVLGKTIAGIRRARNEKN